MRDKKASVAGTGRGVKKTNMTERLEVGRGHV